MLATCCISSWCLTSDCLMLFLILFREEVRAGAVLLNSMIGSFLGGTAYCWIGIGRIEVSMALSACAPELVVVLRGLREASADDGLDMANIDRGRLCAVVEEVGHRGGNR